MTESLSEHHDINKAIAEELRDFAHQILFVTGMFISLDKITDYGQIIKQDLKTGISLARDLIARANELDPDGAFDTHNVTDE